MIKFIVGGAKSGKTSFSISSAKKLPPKRIYIATALPIDDEMKEKIEHHQRERGEEFETWEEPENILPLLSKIDNSINVVILDCITTWTTNMMLNKKDPVSYMEKFLEEVSRLPPKLPFYIISNEVGMGIVPYNKLSREYREVLGTLNIMIAHYAEEVYFMVSGIPWRLK